jgi:hypothetical protein
MNGLLRRMNDTMCLGLATFFASFMLLCGGDSEEITKNKLDAICKDDLVASIDSIAVENLIEKPYYKLVEYKNYSEGKYSKKAVVEYYFLKRVPVKLVRKYRYIQSVRMWDRYSNEYIFIHDTTAIKAEH